MRIVLFGPPGAGKGTQAALLHERRGLRHISTGVIIRRAMKEETPLGREARAFVEAGELVPDHVVRLLAEEAIAQAGRDGFVLDGYPRTVRQAEWLAEFLDAAAAPLDAVVSLRVPDDVIVDRLSKRRVHRETGENFHLDHKPPPAGLEQALIVQRPDDRPESVRKRLEVYAEETAPVLEFYRARGELKPVDGVGDFEDVYDRIEGVLETLPERPTPAH